MGHLGGPVAEAQNREKALPPKELSIQILINGTVSVIDSATLYKIEGFPLALEWSEGRDTDATDCIVLLLGPFAKTDKIGGRDRYQLPEATAGGCRRRPAASL